MTNKPMLSVELRALLERLLSHDFAEECQECGIGYSDAWGELRAILDKPVLESQYDGMTQAQAQSVSDGVDEILHGKPAVQHQGVPVAWMFRWDYDHGNGWCRNAVRFVERIEHVEHEDKSTWRGLTPLYADQAAPVAVVMPDRMKVEPFTTIDRGSKSYKAGYNAAIAEVAKLNGLKT